MRVVIHPNVIMEVYGKTITGLGPSGFSPPVGYFADCSGAVLLLWIVCVVSVLFCYSFMYVCLLIPCAHMLGKG